MYGQFQVDRGSSTATPEGYEATSAVEPKRPRRAWQFVDEFQRLLGEDSEPDVSFFVESWMSGTAAALENFQKRRLSDDEFAHSQEAVLEPGILDTASFVSQKTLHAEFTASTSVQFKRESAAQSQDEASREWDRLAGEIGVGAGTSHPMTRELAYRLLGVTATSTRKQIKAAYRKMVSRWHPDRLELDSEDARLMANERMATINEAYHLLLRALR